MKRNILFLVGVLFLASCSDVVELKKVPNPSGTLDAVLAEREVGATDSTPYFVWVLPKGRGALSDSGKVLAVDRAGSITLKWVADDVLLISAEYARVFKYLPEVMVQLDDGRRRVVKVELDVRDLSYP